MENYIMREITAYKTAFGMVALICILAFALPIEHPAQAQTPGDNDEILTWSDVGSVPRENAPEWIATTAVEQLANRAEGLRCRALDEEQYRLNECRSEDDPVTVEALNFIIHEWTQRNPVHHLNCGISPDAATVTVGQYICTLGYYVDKNFSIIRPDDDRAAHYSFYYRVGANSWHHDPITIRQLYYEGGHLRADAPDDPANPLNIQWSPEEPPEAPNPEVWEETDGEGKLVIENTIEAYNEATGSNIQGSDQYYPIEGGYIRKKNGKCFFHGHDDSYAVLNSCGYGGL